MLPEDVALPIALTIDACALESARPSENFKRLLTWESEGKVRLCKTFRLEIERGRHVPSQRLMAKMANIAEPFTLDMSAFDSDAYLSEDDSGPEFLELASILFPQKLPYKPERLTENQNNDVMHLIAHVEAACHIFVTKNTRDFINDGRRERLHERWGIIVMTLDEVVPYLTTLFPKP